MKAILIAVALICFVQGCSGSGDVYFSDSREEVVAEFIVQLDKSGIPYEKHNGQVLVSAKFAAQAAVIKEKLNQMAFRARNTVWPCPELTQAFKTVLINKKMRFSVTSSGGHESIHWYPASEEESHNVSMEAVDLFLESANEDSKNRCHVKTEIKQNN